MQRIRLALRGWARRREESSRDVKADFMRRNLPDSAGAAKSQPDQPLPSPSTAGIDLEGLQVAYLDDSGGFEHYLDTSSGEVIDIRSSDEEACRAARANGIYRRIPARSAESDARDRSAFVESLEPGKLRDRLRATLGSSDAAAQFRKALAEDRAAERGWYNFKNDRALDVIEAWLRQKR